MNFDKELAKVWKEASKIFREIDSTSNEIDPELLRCTSGGFDVYSREYLKQCPTNAQLKIAELAAKPPYRVLIPSANNQGKTWLMASYARYFYQKYNPSITMITATTAPQVRDGVFRELRTSKPRLLDLLPKANRVESSPDHFIHGFTAENADAFQGRHERNLALLFDEATGIGTEFWERGGTMFGGHEGHAWLASYNPNDPSTQPYIEEESGLWHIVRLNALEHPNILAELRGHAPPIPSAIRLGRVLDRISHECDLVTKPTEEQELQICFEFPRSTGFWWRPKTSAFEAQVLGRWPLIPTESLLSPSVVDKCFGHMWYLSAEWELVIACDVARFGSDRTAIVVRRGPCVLHVETFQKRDSVYIIERLKQLVYKFGQNAEERLTCKIYIDDTGGYGGGVIDHMPGYNIIGLHMSSKSPNPMRTTNMRSHLWFNLAEMIMANAVDVSRIDDATIAEMKRELIAPRYRIDESGRRKLEPKVHIRERLKASPDIADALAMAFFLAI